MEASKIERYSLHDGRRAERRVSETNNASGESEIVTEVFVEEEKPLHLAERVIEKKRPLVYERVVELVDSDGNVVEQKTESIDPVSKMHVVDHIGVADVAVQSLSDDCDCHVTHDEMIDAIVAGVRSAKSEAVVPGMISSLGLADQIAERNDEKEYTMTDKVLMGVIAAMAVGLVYVIFLM
jgi:hypothetical protein